MSSGEFKTGAISPSGCTRTSSTALVLPVAVIVLAAVLTLAARSRPLNEPRSADAALLKEAG